MAISFPVRLLRRLLWTRPFADRTLCHFLRRRLSLPGIFLADLFDDFDLRVVSIRQVPRGNWSTPLVDVVMLLKLAICARSRRLLEIGSFRGYTALFLAQHTQDDARIVTVDNHPDHGQAYLGTPFATKIERRVGESHTAMAGDKPGSYDLIFIDADHSYEGVRRDTELALSLIAPAGYLVWHDYANWGYFNRKNGVPEYLRELDERREARIAHITGTDLAISSPAWSIDGSPACHQFLRALRQARRSDCSYTDAVARWEGGRPQSLLSDA